jgi:uncharacterized protein YrrD
MNNTTNLTSAKSIIGTKVINKLSGSEVGEVKDVIYNPEAKMIEGLILDEGGWFKDAKMIPYSDVVFAGDDGVMIESETAVKRGEEINSSISALSQENDNIKNSHVVTESGKKLGKVVDLHFDRATGMVEQIEVSDGVFGKMISGNKTLDIDQVESVGDTIIVSDMAEQAVDEKSESQGIKAMAHSTMDKANAGIDAVKQKSEEMSKTSNNDMGTDMNQQDIVQPKERIEKKETIIIDHKNRY